MPKKIQKKLLVCFSSQFSAIFNLCNTSNICLFQHTISWCNGLTDRQQTDRRTTGKIYYYPSYYQKKNKPRQGRLCLSKQGNMYYNYYSKKYPNGRDGMSPYSKINKAHCLTRDAYTCQICGATHPLDVHHKDNGGVHINGDKTNNSLSNLITLCRSCHFRLHYGVLGKYINIITRRENGETLQQIADSFGVSRQRIHQIVKKYILSHS